MTIVHRTRIKFCGLTRPGDVQHAVATGADAIGLVFYRKSPRYVTPEQAAALLEKVPAFVSSVGLFVNVEEAELAEVVAQAPVSLLQFHGDESPEYCAALAARVKRPFIRAMRVKPDMGSADLLKYWIAHEQASPWFAGLLLDTFVDGYGGAGKMFDWKVIPQQLAPKIILSGGLDAENVTEAVSKVRPFAVDVSSGIEAAKGIKDMDKMNAFAQAVRQGDGVSERSAPNRENLE